MLALPRRTDLCQPLFLGHSERRAPEDLDATLATELAAGTGLARVHHTVRRA